MKIAIGSDHAGYRYKQLVIEHLRAGGHEVVDYGTNSEESVDYPLFIRPPALAVAAKSARNRLPVLIIGEPGTGKETLARAIHGASLRAKGPLLALDCKSVPANIVDSELFGHEKGAFPGAFAAKTGKLVQADTGTLILDEIAVLPAETQELLDRVLATGEVRPVGLNGSYSVDVRVIATSSRA